MLRESRIREEDPSPHRPDGNVVRLLYRGTGIPGNRGARRVYEIRLVGAVTEAGTIELSAERVHDLPGSCARRPSPETLVAVRPARFRPGSDPAAARKWCGDLLHQCAAALTAANVRCERAAGPAIAPLAAAVVDIPVTAGA